MLPFLNNDNIQGDIPTVLALKLHNTLMEVVVASLSVQLPLLRKHVLNIILCLCELLNECNVFWEGMAPVHPLSEMEELRELVLRALHSEIQICLEVLTTNPTLATGVQWLLRRLKGGFGNYCFVSVFVITTDCSKNKSRCKKNEKKFSLPSVKLGPLFTSPKAFLSGLTLSSGTKVHKSYLLIRQMMNKIH